MTASPTQTIRLHRFALSGHSHRAELFLSLLGIGYEPIDTDLANGAHKQPEFLAKNPFGQVPVMEDGEVVLFDSNAILAYLAIRYDPAGRWLPRGPLQAARVQQWLSIAAGQLAYGPAAARLAAVFGADIDCDRPGGIAAQLYAVLDAHLAHQPFLTGAAPTIADIALYSYTAHAPEGGVSLEGYPRVRAWLARIEALPGFVPMPRTPASAAA